MRILVTVKSVLDPFLSPQPSADGAKVDVDGKKHCMNPYDEVALEKALQLKDAGIASDVYVLNFGQDEQVLRTALALGANKAFMVNAKSDDLGPFTLAMTISSVVKDQDIGLVLMGKQTTDYEGGVVPSMLAEELNWPEALNAYKIDIQNNEATVVCEADEGLETFELSLPAVISADLRLAKPRFVAMPKLIQARRMPIAEVELLPCHNTSVQLQKVYVQEQKRKQHLCENVEEFAQKLKEALV